MNLNDSSLNMTTESMLASTLEASEDGGGDGPDLYKIATDFFIVIDPIILAVGEYVANSGEVKHQSVSDIFYLLKRKTMT